MSEHTKDLPNGTRVHLHQRVVAIVSDPRTNGDTINWVITGLREDAVRLWEPRSDDVEVVSDDEFAADSYQAQRASDGTPQWGY